MESIRSAALALVAGVCCSLSFCPVGLSAPAAKPEVVKAKLKLSIEGDEVRGTLTTNRPEVDCYDGATVRIVDGHDFLIHRYVSYSQHEFGVPLKRFDHHTARARVYASTLEQGGHTYECKEAVSNRLRLPRG